MRVRFPLDFSGLADFLGWPGFPGPGLPRQALQPLGVAPIPLHGVFAFFPAQSSNLRRRAAAVPATYQRREPEKTALHALVRGHLGTLLAQARQASPDDSGSPAFVEKEFQRHLDGGILGDNPLQRRKLG